MTQLPYKKILHRTCLGATSGAAQLVATIGGMHVPHHTGYHQHHQLPTARPHATPTTEHRQPRVLGVEPGAACTRGVHQATGPRPHAPPSTGVPTHTQIPV